MAYHLAFLDPPTRDALRALGSVLRQLRVSRGLSQRGLARRSGLSQSSISRAETGQAPWLSAVWIARLLAGLDLEPGLLGLMDRPHATITPGWTVLARRFQFGRRQQDLDALRAMRQRSLERAISERPRRDAIEPPD